MTIDDYTEAEKKELVRLSQTVGPQTLASEIIQLRREKATLRETISTLVAAKLERSGE